MSNLQTAAVVAVATIPVLYVVDDVIAAYRRRRNRRRAS